MQINNTLYEKKHYYMIILKELGTLKQQMESEALSGTVSKARLDEIYEMYNILFVGLLREGLQYQYIKNATDYKKDIIRLSVDGVNYDCNNSDIFRILNDEYEYVLHISPPEKKENEKSQNATSKISSKTKPPNDKYIADLKKKEDAEPVKPSSVSKKEDSEKQTKSLKDNLEINSQKAKSLQSSPRKKNISHHKIMQSLYGIVMTIVIVVFCVIIFTNDTVKSSFKEMREDLGHYISTSIDTSNTSKPNKIQHPIQ